MLKSGLKILKRTKKTTFEDNASELTIGRQNSVKGCKTHFYLLY